MRLPRPGQNQSEKITCKAKAALSPVALHWHWQMLVLLIGQILQGELSGLEQTSGASWHFCSAADRLCKKKGIVICLDVFHLCAPFEMPGLQWSKAVRRQKEWDLIHFFVMYYSKLGFGWTVSISGLPRRQPFRNTSVWVLSHTTGVCIW